MSPVIRTRRIGDSLMSLMNDMSVGVRNMKYKKSRRMSVSDVDNMISESWVSRKYINKTVEDMLKKPREFKGEVTKEQAIDINELEKKLKVDGVLADALSWSSMHGDALVVAITDASDHSSPLNLDAEDIKKFLVFREDEYKPSSDVISDITSEHYLMPESYTVNVSSKKENEITFHWSRCHRIKLGRQPLSKISEYGESDLQAPADAIKIFEAAVIGIGDLIGSSNVDIIKMAGLNDRIAECEEQAILDYAMIFASTLSSTNLGMIDREDDYVQKQTNFSGLSEVIDRMFSVLAGALDRPITVLFGQSASGFATGEEDNRRYYETINALQESRLRPLQDFIDHFVLDVVAGGVEKLDYSYPSIDSMNAKERAEILGVMSPALVQLVTEGVITEEAALREMVDRGALMSVTEDDIGEVKDVTASYGQW